MHYSVRFLFFFVAVLLGLGCAGEWECDDGIDDDDDGYTDCDDGDCSTDAACVEESDTDWSSCCKHCGSSSQPCGDTCISNSSTCHTSGGCACF